MAAGVPSAAGVAAFESDAASPLEIAGAAEGAGESFASTVGFGSSGVSSFGDSSGKISRSCDDGTLSVTTRPALEPDFLLSLVFGVGAILKY